MTNAITVTELENEAVELLPARETLCHWQPDPSNTNTQFNLLSNDVIQLNILGVQTGVGGGNLYAG